MVKKIPQTKTSKSGRRLSLENRRRRECGVGVSQFGVKTTNTCLLTGSTLWTRKRLVASEMTSLRVVGVHLGGVPYGDGTVHPTDAFGCF